MMKYLKPVAFFVLGALSTVAVTRITPSLPHDLEIYRSKTYELWISNQLESNFPMAPYRHVVRFREICGDSNNICSDWKIVADFLLDSPSRANEWKISDLGSELKIEFPEKTLVHQVGHSWSIERTQ